MVENFISRGGNKKDGPLNMIPCPLFISGTLYLGLHSLLHGGPCKVCGDSLAIES